MSITKSSHEKMWDAILSTNYTLYHEVNMNLQMGLTSSLDEPSTDKDADSNVAELILMRVMLNGFSHAEAMSCISRCRSDKGINL